MPTRPRPRAQRIGDRMKLHRRAVRVGGSRLTVITPRPGMDTRFSTNHYHDTWHLLSDWRGARFLGRLLWGLAYQRVAGTLVLLGRPWLDPNPFDAEAADPIALVPASLTTLRPPQARALRRRPPSIRPDGTVRWQTHGLGAAVVADRAWRDRPLGSWPPPSIPPPGSRVRVDRVGGLIVLTATPDRLRELAVTVYRLCDRAYQGMNYAEVDWPNGEVQVFSDYRRRVSATQVARREVLAEAARSLPADILRPLIWDRAAAVRQRRRP